MIQNLIAFGGQSNMQGECERCSETQAVKGALEYRYLTDNLIPLHNPVGEDILYDKTRGEPIVRGTDLQQWVSRHVLGSACYGNTSLIPSFCRAYCSAAERNVVAVPVCRGGTMLSFWMPGTIGYEIVVEKICAAARRVGQDAQLAKRYFVWLHGESDAANGMSREYYKENLRNFKEHLKADTKIDRFCLIRVGRFAGDQRDEEIMQAQSELCREDPDFLMLTEAAADLCGIPRYMNPELAGHYSAEGLELLGRLAGAALADFEKGK